MHAPASTLLHRHNRSVAAPLASAVFAAALVASGLLGARAARQLIPPEARPEAAMHSRSVPASAGPCFPAAQVALARTDARR